MFEVLTWIAQAGIPVLILVIAAGLVAIKEIGFRLGARWRGPDKDDGVGIVVGGVIGLTAFVLALTLSAATQRMGERRLGALNESNAIGTAWLRAEALGGEGAVLARLIADYAVARLDFATAARGSAEIDDALARSDGATTAIWAATADLSQARTDPVMAQVVVAVNAMFDATAATRLAIESGLPDPMMRLALTMTFASMFALGFQLGVLARPNLAMAALLGLIWAAVTVTLLDMGTARIGRFQVDAAPYLWTLETMKAIDPVGVPD